MIVVDSSVWIAKLRNQDLPSIRQLNSIRNLADILVGDLILFEVLQGMRSDLHAARMESYLRSFEVVSMVDDRLASKAAANFRHLRERGITVRKSIDTIIATFCIENHHQLLHQDRDFSHFEQHLGLHILQTGD